MKDKYFAILSLITIGLMVLFNYLYELDKKTEPIEYPPLNSHRNEVKGYVAKKTTSIAYTNSFRIKLTNGTKFLIHGNRFLSVGDSIYRPEGFDSLYVYRGGHLIFSKHFYLKNK